MTRDGRNGTAARTFPLVVECGSLAFVGQFRGPDPVAHQLAQSIPGEAAYRARRIEQGALGGVGKVDLAGDLRLLEAPDPEVAGFGPPC